MRRFYSARLLIACLSLTATCFAGDTATPACKSGVWVGNSAPVSQVKVDPTSHGVAVTVNKDKDQVPNSIGITFFDANGNKTALELKAVDPWWEPGFTPGSTQTRFSGTLGPSAQSFIGFELQIPFGSEAPTVVRSEDLKKTD